MSATAETQSDEAQRTENIGRIEEIQGVVIEAVFPDKLPEINHAITDQAPRCGPRGRGRRPGRRGRRVARL